MLMATELHPLKKHTISSQVFAAMWGAFLIFLCTQISIPLQPVPITLQTLGVMVVGLTFERRAALNAIFLYLTLGAVGLPIFSEFSGGFIHIIGPTGGYLMGFAVAIMVMGFFRSIFTQRNIGLNVMNCLLGSAVIYIFGVSWLSRFIGFEMALKGGFYPFILPGIIKAVLLSFILRYLKTDRLSR